MFEARIINYLIQSQFYVYNKQAKSIQATGPLFKWLIVMKDAVAMRSLIINTVSASDRVTFISAATSSEASPVVLTKIDLMQPSMIGTWEPWEKMWNLYTLDVFSPFRGLFGKEFVVASLPVGQFKKQRKILCCKSSTMVALVCERSRLGARDGASARIWGFCVPTTCECYM